MKKSLFAGAVFLVIGITGVNGFCTTKKAEKIDGKKEFQEYCAACHPNGGNIINKMKPLSSKSLKANGVNGVAGIVKKMRNPGPAMTKYDEKSISNKKAKAIAEYILKTFK